MKLISTLADRLKIQSPTKFFNLNVELKVLTTRLNNITPVS